MLISPRFSLLALSFRFRPERPLWLLVVIAGLLPGWVRGEEPSKPGGNSPLVNARPEGETALTEAQVEQLISDLDHADFKVREEATRKLAAAAALAIPAVEKAANGDNLEVATRSLQILKMLYEGKDVDAQAEAAIAIKRLCDSPNKSIARRASAILDGNRGAETAKGAGRLPPLRLNARALAPGGMARQVSVQNVNGQVQILVVEPDRRIEIRHNNQRQIVVKISPSNPDAAGKEARESKAQDLQELREKHPEAAQLFEEYAADNAMPDLGGNLFPGGFPPGFPQLPGLRGRRVNPRPPVQRRLEGGVPRAPLPGESVESLEKTQRRLHGFVERLRRLSAEESIAPQELRKLADELKAIEEEVQESAEDLRELGSP